MIDLVSTRTTDVQTARCAQLLAAVISQAIKDAAIKPSDEERKHRRNSRHAYRAIKFLFEKKGIFDAYAYMIGMSGDSIRAALLSNVTLQKQSLFTEEERRIIKVRHLWYLGNPNPLKASDLNYLEREYDYEEENGQSRNQSKRPVRGSSNAGNS